MDPETLLAYEVGFKSDWADQTVRFNAAAFYYDWEDLQSFQVLVDPATGEGIPQLTNVPEASLMGAELEITVAPGNGWYLQGGLGLLDSEIDNPGTIAGVNAGNAIPNTPDITLWFGSQGHCALQRHPGSAVEYRYRDDVTYDLGNAANLSQEGFWNVDARVIYTFGSNEQYEINAWGENLTGEEYATVHQPGGTE